VTPATKADLAALGVELSRDIANLAAGVGSDIRAIREDVALIHADLAGMRDDIAGMREDVAGIRQLLERRRPWWRL
jgi:hypothetical protein